MRYSDMNSSNLDDFIDIRILYAKLQLVFDNLTGTVTHILQIDNNYKVFVVVDEFIQGFTYVNRDKSKNLCETLESAVKACSEPERPNGTIEDIPLYKSSILKTPPIGFTLATV